MTTPRHHWTESENELLRQRYPHERTTDLAAALGLPVRLVYAHAYRLGLHKSAAFAASSASGRILKGGKLSQATQFKPGQAPKNKGVKGWQAGGRSVQTQFKPGIKPHTWVPVGTYRISGEGCLVRKVSDAKGSPSVRWHGVHRIVWEAAHGPTPHGHVVVFKPGMHTTELAGITLDTVELVSRAELMRRNSIHQLPAELAELHHIRGVLKRAINTKSKQESSAHE